MDKYHGLKLPQNISGVYNRYHRANVVVLSEDIVYLLNYLYMAATASQGHVEPFMAPCPFQDMWIVHDMTINTKFSLTPQHVPHKY